MKKCIVQADDIFCAKSAALVGGQAERARVLGIDEKDLALYTAEEILDLATQGNVLSESSSGNIVRFRERGAYFMHGKARAGEENRRGFEGSALELRI